jgi:Spermidine synthase
VSGRIAEIDWQSTPWGEISLRRRHDPVLDREVFEVLLGDEYLMSSSFTAAEEELASAALDSVSGNELRVLVGGLGLGHTAREVLRDGRVSQMTVVDAIAPVISWHRRGLVPLGLEVSGDARTHLFEGDFFDLVQHRGGPCAESSWDAVIVDIDHSPRHNLAPGNEWLYTDAGTRALAALLDDEGVFALWSNDPPDEEYLQVLRGTFAHVSSRIVSFANPLQDRVATNTVYVAQVGEK